MAVDRGHKGWKTVFPLKIKIRILVMITFSMEIKKLLKYTNQDSV